MFKSVLKWLHHFIKNGNLLFTVLENVKGINQRIGGRESFMQTTVRKLRSTCPEFSWDAFTLNARDFGLAQERTRVFLVGVRASSKLTRVPTHAPPFGGANLADFLDWGQPNTARATLQPTCTPTSAITRP